MLQTGHVLIGTEGQLLNLDTGFCSIMHASPEDMVGRLVMDVTAPADREECTVAIDRLRRTGEPFVIVKRFMRDDGSLVWVRNTVSITVDGGHPGLIMATIELIDESETTRSPAMLLDNARILIAARKARGMVCDPTLFSEPAWDTILEIYIGEAEGRVIDVETLSDKLGHSPSVTGRWIKALLQYGVLEVELRNPHPETAKSYRLTAGTHRRLETYLARVGPLDQSIWDRVDERRPSRA